jgi:hypothetical protein
MEGGRERGRERERTKKKNHIHTHIYRTVIMCYHYSHYIIYYNIYICMFWWLDVYVLAKPACVCFKVRLCRCSVFSDQWTSIPGMMWEMNDMLTKSTLDQHGSTSVVPGCSNRVATKVFCMVRRFWCFFSVRMPRCVVNRWIQIAYLLSLYIYICIHNSMILHTDMHYLMLYLKCANM